MSKLLDPSRHIDKSGDVRLPESLQHLRNVHRDAVILELVLYAQELQDRVEDLECWLPRPPEEEDDER